MVLMVSKLNDTSISECFIGFKNLEFSLVVYGNSLLYSDLLLFVKYF
jgi:hypothetical protein